MRFVLLHGPLQAPLFADRVVIHRVRGRDQSWFRRDLQEPLRRGYFPFVPEAPGGRPTGAPCASCDSGPEFACALGAHDSSCASGFCGETGLCEEARQCPPGYYLADLDNNGVYAGFDDGAGTAPTAAYDRFWCEACPAGRYSNVTGQQSSSCAGPCAAGYYCPAASLSPRAFECGGDAPMN